MIGYRCAAAITANLLLAAPGQNAVAVTPESAKQQSETLFGSVDQFWSQQVASLGGRYRPPKLAFFTKPVANVCEVQAPIAGPFYCPVNETVYLDQPFLLRLETLPENERQLAFGYVVAHEVAHHIQNVIGTTGMVEQARSRSTPELASRILLTMELQADCYAGLWARWAEPRGALRPPADPAATLNGVATIAQEWQRHLTAGQEMLDPLAHGSPGQRLTWFDRGRDTGGFGDCDTFGANAHGRL